MRLHTNTLTHADFINAQLVAKVQADVTMHNSRSRDHGFTVKLTGDAPNRPNGWNRDRDGDVHAASWDQWGIFLSVLFDRDPDMVVGSVGRPTYANVYDFDRKTQGRFARHLNSEGVRVAPGNMFSAIDLPLGLYTPVDMHNRHTFDYRGVQATGGDIYRCRKCTAAKVVTR